MTGLRHETRLTRRSAVALLGSTVLLGPSMAHADDCPNIRAAQALVDARISGIGAWVATDGAVVVANARAAAEHLESALPATGAAVDAAAKEELLSLAAVMAGSTLLVIGVVGAASVGTVMVAGLFVSSGLLVAEAILSPEALNPQEAATMQVVGDLEHALSAASDSGPIAARTATGLAAHLVGGAVLVYEFAQFVNALEAGTIAGARFDQMRNDIAAIKTALAPLDDPGRLRDTRLNALEALKGELVAFSGGCDVPIPRP